MATPSRFGVSEARWWGQTREGHRNNAPQKAVFTMTSDVFKSGSGPEVGFDWPAREGLRRGSLNPSSVDCPQVHVVKQPPCILQGHPQASKDNLVPCAFSVAFLYLWSCTVGSLIIADPECCPSLE